MQYLLTLAVLAGLFVLLWLAPAEELLMQAKLKKRYMSYARGSGCEKSGEKRRKLYCVLGEKTFDVLHLSLSEEGRLKDLERIEKAGLEESLTPEGCKGLRVLAAGGMCLLYGLLWAASGYEMLLLVIAAAAGITGWRLPSLMLARTAARRTGQLERELPYALHTMAILTDAGLSLADAMGKIGEDKDGVLAGEFRRVLEEVNMGTGQTEAIKNSALRSGSRKYSSFVFSLCQSIEKGSSGISGDLKQIARETWAERKAAAKDAGSKASVRLLMPMLLFTFPAFMMIVLGPALITFMTIF